VSKKRQFDDYGNELCPLGDAWYRAEAVLPKGWAVIGLSLTVSHLDHDDWEAVAAWSSHNWEDEAPDPEECTVIGPTPIAALKALAAHFAALTAKEPIAPA
jgi:hypothetical protein